ncbi:MarR family winged helix-turn-helix transcriptional regulator [Bacillus sp. DJP31]|uniref:MarR family winged helix-turn-helix transcriptional regulator n=1 Tax=Bacillus sp. DJP31 TaxID=3409789 RepID=UPI003BB6820E
MEKLKQQDTDPALQLFIVLSRSYKSLIEYAKQDIKRYKLNPTEFAVLELLYNKGPQPLQKIGDRILLASGSITYVVDKLEQKGFLNRKPCSRDRRITYAEISLKGIELMESIFPKHAEAIKKLMSGLSEKEMELTKETLKRLGKNIKN